MVLLQDILDRDSSSATINLLLVRIYVYSPTSYRGTYIQYINPEQTPPPSHRIPNKNLQNKKPADNKKIAHRENTPNTTSSTGDDEIYNIFSHGNPYIHIFQPSVINHAWTHDSIDPFVHLHMCTYIYI